MTIARAIHGGRGTVTLDYVDDLESFYYVLAYTFVVLTPGLLPPPIHPPSNLSGPLSKIDLSPGEFPKPLSVRGKWT
jgi:hypothetical protein